MNELPSLSDAYWAYKAATKRIPNQYQMEAQRHLEELHRLVRYSSASYEPAPWKRPTVNANGYSRRRQ